MKECEEGEKEWSEEKVESEGRGGGGSVEGEKKDDMGKGCRRDPQR